MTEHIHPRSMYFKTFALLFVLLVLTIAAAKVPLGALNVVVAMVIAAAKAVLVVLYFMNVKYSSRLVWLWAAAGFVWLFILFTTLSDYITRDWIRIVGWQ